MGTTVFAALLVAFGLTSRHRHPAQGAAAGSLLPTAAGTLQDSVPRPERVG
jgi:hypothetical protein